eukprot:s397_g3.t1
MAERDHARERRRSPLALPLAVTCAVAMAGKLNDCVPSAIWRPPCAQRGVSFEAAQLKRQERESLKVSRDFARAHDLRTLRPASESTASAEVRKATSQIDRLVKARRFQEAWQLFGTLDKEGEVQYCVGLNLCAKAGWTEEAQALWADMKHDWKSVVAYTTMIKMYADTKRVHQAEQLFEEMQRNGVSPNLITYNTMISAYGAVSMAEKARETFDSIPEAVVAEANMSSRESSYAGVMWAYARLGDYASVREFFMDMTSKGVQPNRNHFNALIISCAKDGLAETARSVFEMLPHYNIQAECDTWTGLLSCHRRDPSQCRKILEEMISSGVQPSGLTYQELLRAYVYAGDGPSAREMLEDMEKFGAWQGTHVTMRSRDWRSYWMCRLSLLPECGSVGAFGKLRVA